MLSPEVWNFKPPSHHFSEYFGSPQSLPKVKKEIRNHYFNHSVTVILPDTVLVPEYFNSPLVEDCVYYKIEHIPIQKFIQKQFIDFFVKKGQLWALSVDTHIDTDNCAAITPSGHFVLNLDKETYQTVGLEGTQSQFSTERYVVQIDLKNPSFSPGKKNFERTLKCLSEFVKLQMNFLIAWEPPEPADKDKEVCPSSVASYFAAQGHTVTECKPQINTSRQFSVKIPTKTAPHSEVLEWLGAVALSVDMRREDAEGDYLSSFSGPVEDSQETQVAVLKHFGFFTTSQIENMFQVFSSYVEKRKDLTWAALHIQGFSDSPVSWLLQEHTYHSNGDNDYTILLQPDLSFCVLRSSNFSRKMKFKLR